MKINKGYIILTIGFCIVSFQLINNRMENIKEKNQIEYTIKKEFGYFVKTEDNTYNMILEIPKINLRKGIYDKYDNRNNINKNITIHKNSNYPTEENSNLILMAHSGTGEKAYFNNLYKLDEDSLIKIYYQNKIYTYKINNSYQVEKNGKVDIIRNELKKTITLITCNQKDKTKQLVYIGYLIDEI